MEIISKFREFVLKCGRVWMVTRKPTKEEFKVTAQASGLGILIVGAIGFAISVLLRLSNLR